MPQRSCFGCTLPAAQLARHAPAEHETVVSLQASDELHPIEHGPSLQLNVAPVQASVPVQLMSQAQAC